ncbi:MAG: hypothetical protein ACM3N4_00495, partial [Nitrososphaerota archaeon]
MGTIYHGTAETVLKLVKVQSAYRAILALAGAIGNRNRLLAEAHASPFIRMASRRSGFTGYFV